ncbi:MAG: P-loop NTPase [Janthinobacterium lividum]
MFSKSVPLNPQDIVQTLKLMSDPLSNRSIIEAGLIEGVTIDKGCATISLRIPSDKIAQYEPVRQKIQQAVEGLVGIEKALVIMTEHKGEVIKNNTPKMPLAEKLVLPQIRHIIAVASGKGGVGKSLVSLNLALALKNQGLRVGILDADIYGPSLAKMLNLLDKPEVDAQKKITPLKKFGLQCMSMGFFMAEETPVIWRGPMIQSSLLQFVRDVTWQDLDVLVIDLPPGTGDVQLTLVQKIPLSGAVIVSTPQDLALLDARRGLSMFQKLDVLILGIVENMSYFTCPQCNHKSDIFHQGGVRQEAEKLSVPFLGEIPLMIDLRKSADQGQPFVEAYPNHVITQQFSKMAENITTQFKHKTK